MRTESKTKNRRESAAANRFIGDYDTVRPLLRYISYGCYHKSFLVERLGQSSRKDVLCRLQPLDPVDTSRHEEIIKTMFSFSPNGEAELFLEKPVRLPPTRAEMRGAHAMRARPRRAASNTTPRRTAAAPSSGSKMPDTWSLHLSDAFEGRKADLELAVEIININNQPGRPILEKCHALKSSIVCALRVCFSDMFDKCEKPYYSLQSYSRRFCADSCSPNLRSVSDLLVSAY